MIELKSALDGMFHTMWWLDAQRKFTLWTTEQEPAKRQLGDKWLVAQVVESGGFYWTVVCWRHDDHATLIEKQKGDCTYCTLATVSLYTYNV